MSQHYSDPKRVSDPYTLPNVEVFHVTHGPSGLGSIDGEAIIREDQEPMEDGWYWWGCFPGCLPDGEPNGPFETEAEALDDAQSSNDLDEDDEE